MPKSKALTQEQQDFLQKFLGQGRRRDEKLTGQYKDFLRRKTKVLTEVFKLAPEDPVRKTLLDLVAQIDQSKEGQDGVANFKEAFDALDDVKRQARRAARGLPALTVAEVEKKIQALARNGMHRTRQATDLWERMDPLLTELRKPENKASSCQTLEAALEFRQRFAATEDGLRAQLVTLGKAKSDIVTDLKRFPLEEKEQTIRAEIAYLQDVDPQSAAPLPGLLDKAKATFMPAEAVEKGFADKVAQFEKLIAECKSLGTFQQRQQEKLPDSFKELERRDEQRRLVTELILDSEDISDELTFLQTREKPKNVVAPYDWSNSAGFRNFTDNLPESLEQITPEKTQTCAAAARRLIEDLLRNHGNDPDLVFDLSIQTPETLEELILKSLPLDIPPEPSPQLVQVRDGFLQQQGGQNKEEFKQYQKYIAAKERFQADGNIRAYRIALEGVFKACNRKLGNQDFRTKPENATAVGQYQALVDAIQPELDQLRKSSEFAQALAGEMNNAINQHCPNKTSEQMQEVKVKLPDGNEMDFKAPQTITFNNKQLTLKRALGAGAFGVALRYEDPEGNVFVVKAALDPSDQSKNTFNEELKMHKHLMGGGDEGKNHVLKLEGNARGPDGSLYMLMEEAGGGTLDKLGDSLRALNGTGVLSQESQNVIQKHLIRQAITGLKYLQDRNMTHHDIKSDNYFLGGDGTLKLSDFGSSQVGFSEDGEVLGPKVRDIHGAPTYKSPELDNSNSLTITGKSDTYTLGTMIVALMSPTDAMEKVEGLSRRGDYRDPHGVTGLGRLVNAMLDDDPNKRPTLEAVQLSTFLNDNETDYDPELVQALLQASLAYSKKVGSEVRDRQGEIGLVNSTVTKGQGKIELEDDAKLNEQLQAQPNPVTVIEARLNNASRAVESIRNTLKRFAADFEQLRNSNLAPEERARQIAALEQRYWDEVRQRFTGDAANAMRYLRAAQRMYELANLNDNALRQKIADQGTIVEQEYLNLLKILQDRAAQLKKEIEAINQRDDVKPFVEAVQRAQQALVRGPETPGKKLPTPEDRTKSLVGRQEKLEKLAASLIGKDEKRTQISQRLLQRAARYIKLQRFDDAAKVLDRLEKMLHKLGGLKLFEKQMQEAIAQANQLEGDAKTDVETLLKQAIVSAKSKKMDEAYEHYQKAARKLRKYALEKELVSV